MILSIVELFADVKYFVFCWVYIKPLFFISLKKKLNSNKIKKIHHIFECPDEGLVK